MTELNCNRRKFLGLASLALAAPAISAAETPVRCLAYDAKGEPLPAADFGRFYLCDLQMRPITTPFTAATGEVRFTPPADRPFRIAMPLAVPGFGQVYVYADNSGAGYTRRSLHRATPLVLNYAFARDRMATVRKLEAEFGRLGIDISSQTQQRIDSAQAALALAGAKGASRTTQVQASMESLRDSLYAGEMLVVARAQHAIARQPVRYGFLFGCCGFGLARGSPEYRKLFMALFNYATLPIYERWVEGKKGHPNYSALEGDLDTIIGTRILAKGHTGVWLNPKNVPKWLQNLPYDETKRYCLAHVQQAITRYRPRIHIWDVVNEMALQPEVGLGIAGFTREQNVDLTVTALETAHAADPTCFRCVNNTATWADYYMGDHPAGSPFYDHPAPWQQSPYDYLAMLRDAKAEYEVIGLQYYYSGRDLLELERNLETFRDFGKAIHITEMEFPSALVPGAGYWGGGEGNASMLWHGDHFTETIQADWIEQAYTLFYSKPWVEAISYWDFSDPAFIGGGGFLREDGTPKESYHRLLNLQAKWQHTGTEQ